MAYVSTAEVPSDGGTTARVALFGRLDVIDGFTSQVRLCSPFGNSLTTAWSE